jgi:transposase InsO family protein
MVETVFKTIKSELVWRTIFQTRAAAELAIGRYIDGFYNPRRRHSALGYKSPGIIRGHNGHLRVKASPLNPGKSSIV